MDYAIQIGQRIKAYRTARSLTVKELAAKAQITPSMLSQIERGQANPSLNTIRLLSAALDEPMFRFFLDDVNVQNEVVRLEERKPGSLNMAWNTSFSPLIRAVLWR